WSMDHVGMLARTVADVAMLCRALGAQREIARASGGSVTVGVPDRFFEAVDEDVTAAFDQAMMLLRGVGAKIVRVALPPGFEALVEAGVITMYAEMAAYHRDRYALYAAKFPPRLSTLIEVGLTISAADYLRAQQIRKLETAALSHLLDEVTVLATPATPTP